ncbi:MAG: biofilm regulation protein kinase SiaB [Halothiobacillaceae bacterium]
MDVIDLFALRDSFTRHRILLCFNGPIMRSIIEELGVALKAYLETNESRETAATDVFAVYVEMSQNIRHYARVKGYGETESIATLLVGRREDGSYRVQVGNLVEQADGEALVDRVRTLAAMDKAALKAEFKTQLRRPRESGATSGAGLGLIDIARKASEPPEAQLSELPDGKAFFSLGVVV